MKNHKKIYKVILDILDKTSPDRRSLIDEAVSRLGANRTERDRNRALVGSILTEMTDNGVVTVDGGLYSLASSKPVALRVESCEEEMLALLRESPLSKQELRSAMIKRFGTDKTTSTRDDDILFSLIGQVTNRLISFGVIELIDSKYRIAPEKVAKIDDIASILALKTEFMTRLHAKGGEFFEHYIVTLLSKHLAKSGKLITEAYVTGGTVDGGIDGIIKTVDSLGFREVLMIQAKNGLETTNETTVRGFYGAVCAAQGTRGVFATTSDFHPEAAKFLDGIDNCVGVNADKIFTMAIECGYGIKKSGNVYAVDHKLL